MLPRPARARIGDPSPQVDDPPPVDVHRAAGAEVAALDEVRDEDVHDRPVAVLHDRVDPPAIVELDLVGDCQAVGRRRCVGRHPFTDPWSSAAITWRWKRMNTISVGRRIRIVPAHSNGMSVA